MKAPNIFLCSLHLLHAIMGLHIFSAGYAQLALSYCLVTSVSTRQTSLMQEVSSSSSVKQSRGILLLQAQVSIQELFFNKCHRSQCCFLVATALS